MVNTIHLRPPLWRVLVQLLLFIVPNVIVIGLGILRDNDLLVYAGGALILVSWVPTFLVYVTVDVSPSEIRIAFRGRSRTVPRQQLNAIRLIYSDPDPRSSRPVGNPAGIVFQFEDQAVEFTTFMLPAKTVSRFLTEMKSQGALVEDEAPTPVSGPPTTVSKPSGPPEVRLAPPLWATLFQPIFLTTLGSLAVIILADPEKRLVTVLGAGGIFLLIGLLVTWIGYGKIDVHLDVIAWRAGPKSGTLPLSSLEGLVVYYPDYKAAAFVPGARQLISDPVENKRAADKKKDQAYGLWLQTPHGTVKIPTGLINRKRLLNFLAELERKDFPVQHGG